ncbi:MAG: alpha/beta fold hydrolase [Chloroflexi bacterium]|nr:alpha/beta fold hydrolase [Chloroflexota bacterium]
MRNAIVLIASVALWLGLSAAGNASGLQQSGPGVSVLDSKGAPASRITDGDSIKLRAQTDAKAAASTRLVFRLAGDDIAVGECSMPAGSDSCETASLRAYGWYWGKDGQPRASRPIGARSDDGRVSLTGTLALTPRPVVMVHGFSSSWEAWSNYVGDSGYLAGIGVAGFAVGDGRVPGVMNTGSIDNPTGRTNTLDQNARILGSYIAAVKQKTGAQQVDLVGHSMGGLIARYYLDRVMGERDVAQLLMLGTPNLGTDCGVLPSALSFYLPATLEIRTSYVSGIFNRQITHRKGVPFYMGAGIPIADPVKSPCADVPSDIAISRASVSGVQGTVVEVPLVHPDLNTSRDVFDTVVRPFVQRLPGQFPEAADLTPPAESADALQFTNLHSGHLNPGQTENFTINLDSVAVASFALFDPSRSLTVTVRGATGNVITLDPRANGLIVVDKPESLVHLGYGFNNPRPGPWQITLATTGRTPARGADYALTAQLHGGAILQARTSELLPAQGAPLVVTAKLVLNGQPVAIRAASARIRAPGGSDETVALAGSGTGEWSAAYTPKEAGLHAVDVSVSATGADNIAIERAAFLSFDAQPPAESIMPVVNLALLIGALLLIVVGVFMLARRARRRIMRR